MSPEQLTHWGPRTGSGQEFVVFTLHKAYCNSKYPELADKGEVCDHGSRNQKIAPKRRQNNENDSLVDRNYAVRARRSTSGRIHQSADQTANCAHDGPGEKETRDGHDMVA